MSQSELLIYILSLLTDLNIPYMVTGSVVSSIQGDPRSTHDIDVVVMLEKAAVQSFSAAIPKDVFYLNEHSVLEAVERKHMFNLLEGATGNKVDFWLLTEDPFDVSRFSRRRNAAIFGLTNFYVSAPEDTILSKLRWAKLAGGSEKQLTDAIRVFEMQFDQLDMTYLRQWVEQLHLQEQWQQLIERAAPY
ncbi:hypothetical protein ACAW74_03550 [Fibrella sp. WM1]|uniref:hypothetical protein n=1 Tax=Fibrella musci TaxID=3242485 RepID=UPI00351FAA1D